MTETVTMQNLNARWSEIQAEQTFISKAWNGFKEKFDVGQSASDCESMLEKYKNHEISLDEAMEYLNNFEKKQENMTDLFANIATGIGSIALATFTGGTSIGWSLALKLGAPIGAAIKTVLKGLDRATNDIKGDALDGKLIAKDLISGAVTGTTSAVSSGVYKGVTKASLAVSMKNGGKCGLECGAVSGGIAYLTDVIFDKDKKFSFKEFFKNVFTSASVSGSVGVAVGGGVFGAEKLANHLGKSFVLANEAKNIDNEVILSEGIVIARDSGLSSTRKVGGTQLRTAAGAVKNFFAA